MPPKRKQTEFWCRCPQCGPSGVLRNEVDHHTHELELLSAANPHFWNAVEDSRILNLNSSAPAPAASPDSPDFERRKRQKLENKLDRLVQRAKFLEIECHEFSRVLTDFHNSEASSNWFIRLTHMIRRRQLLSQADHISKCAIAIPVKYIGQNEDNIAHILSRIRHLLPSEPGRSCIYYDSCK